MRHALVTCDWCETSLDANEDDIVLEHGWITTEEYDASKDDLVERDFCCRDCVSSYYG